MAARSDFKQNLTIYHNKCHQWVHSEDNELLQANIFRQGPGS